MADEIKNSNENILVKADQQNVLAIDPNSVIENGVVKQRVVKHEELVMYVNLEADVVPRSHVFLAGDNSKNKPSVVSLYQGNINFLKPKGSNTFDTSWTDMYTDKLNGKQDIYYSSISQNFGIRSLDIKNGFLTPPEVTINFVDVRGKTLFESPDNSPYKAFFHIPYPVFFLTLKGFYGKAVRYELQLLDFKARFDSATGNYEVTCKFVGNTYKLLAEIPMIWIMTAPYMFSQQIRIQDKNKNQGTSPTEQTYKDIETTKGFQVLTQVYDEYKAKGIIPQDFPVMTVKELALKAANLDFLLEKRVFSQVIDAAVLSDMDAYGGLLDSFASVINDNRSQYLDTTPMSLDGKFFFAAKKWENQTDTIDRAFQLTVDRFTELLNSNKAFGSQQTPSKDKTNSKIVPDQILVRINPNYRKTSDTGRPFYAPQLIVEQINAIRKTYLSNRQKVESALNEKINEALKNKDSGIGFEPTIRNLFAVIVAGADTFIRLISDVHDAAAHVADQRSSLIGDKLEGLFPFPSISKTGGDDKPSVLVYPGDPAVADKLNAYDYNLWPEVEFVENFFNTAAQIEGDISTKENQLKSLNIVFPNTGDSNLNFSETITWNPRQHPYATKTTIAIFYELYERAYVVAVYSGLENFKTLKKLGSLEGKNVVAAVDHVVQIQHKLKQLSSLANLKNQLFMLSPYLRWENTTDEIFTTPYLKSVQEASYSLSAFVSGSTVQSAQYGNYDEVSAELNAYQPNLTNTLYPFNDPAFYRTWEGKGQDSTLNDSDFSIKQSLQLDFDGGIVSNNPADQHWYKGANPDNIFKDALLHFSGTTFSIFNTPYFTNALNRDIDDGSYLRTAYLFLNALPYVNLYNKFNGLNDYVLASLSQVAATHKLPALFVLKLGSVWNRYKHFKQTDNDLFTGVFADNDISTLFDNGQSLNLTLTFNGRPQRNFAGHYNHAGLYPFYQDKVYKAFNGEPFFNLSGVTSEVDYNHAIQKQIDAGNLLINEPVTNDIHIEFLTPYVKNPDGTYFLLPSSSKQYAESFSSIIRYQNQTTRIIWFDQTIGEYSFSGLTYPAPAEHFRSHNDLFEIDTEYKKNLDLLATFRPEVLDLFEAEFLNFAKDVIYTGGTLNFKTILKNLMSTKEASADAQQGVAAAISSELTSLYYTFTNANPKEIDLYTFNNFIDHHTKTIYDGYDVIQVSSGSTADLETIIGEDRSGYYASFFQEFNISYRKDYFRVLRPVVRFYAGLKRSVAITPTDFVVRMQNLVNSYDVKLDDVVSSIFKETNKISLDAVTSTTRTLPEYNIKETLKLDLYNSFKKFNDQWVGGNALNDSLMSDFLFLDRANRDIGQKAFISLFNFKDILDQRNANTDLYSFISVILKDSNFNFYALPAYINFYGITDAGDFSMPKYTTSQVAADLFGTFLEVDYTKSSPKFICQYVGLSSSYLDMAGVSEQYQYKNDSFNIANPNKNPYLFTPDEYKNNQYDKSNRVVSFEVNFGDQAQGIFKTLSLDQGTIKNTFESYNVIENLNKYNNNNDVAQAHIGMYQVYLNRNYTCEVTAMGNFMIQPNMYFYLRNVPMFEGTYLILQVSHKIDGNNIVETTFQGARQPYAALPDLKDVLISTNKEIYQRLLIAAKTKIKP